MELGCGSILGTGQESWILILGHWVSDGGQVICILLALVSLYGVLLCGDPLGSLLDNKIYRLEQANILHEWYVRNSCEEKYLGCPCKTQPKREVPAGALWVAEPPRRGWQWILTPHPQRHQRQAPHSYSVAPDALMSAQSQQAPWSLKACVWDPRAWVWILELQVTYTLHAFSFFTCKMV